jgi:hypothetical protein
MKSARLDPPSPIRGSRRHERASTLSGVLHRSLVKRPRSLLRPPCRWAGEARALHGAARPADHAPRASAMHQLRERGPQHQGPRPWVRSN